MKLLVLVLNRMNSLEPLLERFSLDGIKGATILNSHGMAHTLSERGGAFFGSLMAALSPDSTENRTVFTVLPDEQIPLALAAIEAVVGDLSQPDTGIVFTVPVDFTRGISQGGESKQSLR